MGSKNDQCTSKDCHRQGCRGMCGGGMFRASFAPRGVGKGSPREVLSKARHNKETAQKSGAIHSHIDGLKEVGKRT